MTFFAKTWCLLTHRRHWQFYGYGDWRIQECTKCGDRWRVPFNEAKGPRVPTPEERGAE